MKNVSLIDTVMVGIERYESKIQNSKMEVVKNLKEIEHLQNVISNINFGSNELKNLYWNISNLYSEINSKENQIEYDKEFLKHLYKELENAFPENEYNEILLQNELEIENNLNENLKEIKNKFTNFKIQNSNSIMLKIEKPDWRRNAFLEIHYTDDNSYQYKAYGRNVNKVDVKVKRKSTIIKYISEFIKINE